MTRYVYEIQVVRPTGPRHTVIFERVVFTLYAETARLARLRAVEVLGKMDIESHSPLVVKWIGRVT